MICEFFDNCKFFKAAMTEMPKSAEYIKNKLCFNDYNACSRYREFKDDTSPENSRFAVHKTAKNASTLVIPDEVKFDDNCKYITD